MSNKVYYAEQSETVTHIGTTQLDSPCLVSDLYALYANRGVYPGVTDPQDPPQETWPCIESQTPPDSITTLESGIVTGVDFVGPTPGKKPPHA